MKSNLSGLDSLYTAKKNIEQIIDSNTKNERLMAVTKRTGIPLDKLLKIEVNINYNRVDINSEYNIRHYEGSILRLIDTLNETKEFCGSVYKKIGIEIKHEKDDDSYTMDMTDERDNQLVSIHFSMSNSKPDKEELQTIYLYTHLYKDFTKTDSFPTELFSLINNNIIIDDIEKTYKNLVIEGMDTNGEESLTDMMKNLGMELYKSDLTMKNVGGYNDVKERIEKEIFTPFIHHDILDEIKKHTRLSKSSETNSALFYGEPGTGKTLMARVISNENNLNFIYMNLSQIYSHWYGDSSKRMEAALDLVKEYSQKNGKTVLFIDEIDSLGNRQYSSSESNKVLNVLLTKLSGIKSEENENLLLIGCTNLLNNLDNALLSRFKSKVYFRDPNKEDREGIISAYSQNLKKNEIETLAEKMEGLTGRDIESIASIAEENLAYDIANKKKNYYTPKLEEYMEAVNIFRQHINDEKLKSNGMYG